MNSTITLNLTPDADPLITAHKGYAIVSENGSTILFPSVEAIDHWIDILHQAADVLGAANG